MEKSDNSDSLKYQIAIKYAERGKFKRAINYYQPLIRSKNYNLDGSIYFRIGYCYSLLGNTKKAKKYIKRAINKNPSQKHYKEFLKELNKK